MKNKILFIDDENDILDAYGYIFEDSSSENSSPQVDSLFGKQASPSSSSQSDDPIKKYQFEIATASSGEEGIKIFEESLKNDPIKIVFTDMRMPPGIDGKETAKRIRQLDPDVEIVIVTAYSDSNLSEIVSEIGRPDKILYVKKPFDETEIKQMAINLTEKYNNGKAKERFMSAITHELKTPLTAIIGFNDLMLSEEAPSEFVEYLQIQRKNIHILQDLIANIIQYTEHNKLKDHVKDNVSINKILSEVYKVFSKTRVTEGITFQYKEEGKASLKCNPYELTMVLHNLLDNSVKFSKEGTVNVSLLAKDDSFQIKVSDNGVGIPKEKINEVFNPYTRLESECRSLPGLGLGLHYVKKFAQRHNGIIDMETTLGKGTSVTLTFPNKG